MMMSVIMMCDMMQDDVIVIVVSKDAAHPFMFTDTNFRSVTSCELPVGKLAHKVI